MLKALRSYSLISTLLRKNETQKCPRPSPAARRKACAHLLETSGMNQRRASGLVGLHRLVARNTAVRDSPTAAWKRAPTMRERIGWGTWMRPRLVARC